MPLDNRCARQARAVYCALLESGQSAARKWILNPIRLPALCAHVAKPSACHGLVHKGRPGLQPPNSQATCLRSQLCGWQASTSQGLDADIGHFLPTATLSSRRSVHKSQAQGGSQLHSLKNSKGLKLCMHTNIQRENSDPGANCKSISFYRFSYVYLE